MPVYKYQPYYQYDGPSHSQPWREELTAEEVDSNIEYFFDEVDRYFDDVEAEFERLPDNYVSITSEITQKDCDERVKQCLNSLDLYANRIPAK